MKKAIHKRKGLALAALLAVSLSVGAVDAEAAQKLSVDSVKVMGNTRWKESEILDLLPALKQQDVDPQKLSRQILLVNDAGALELKANFVQKSAGRYDVEVSVQEKKAQRASINVNNSGNEYTGDWRIGLNYMDRNLSGRSDAIGVAYVTSPDHWADVKQAAFAYRRLLPQSADSMYLSYSYSDVDLGTIANFGGLGINATGKGQTAALHYQRNLTYTKKKKEVLDFGFDWKKYENAADYRAGGRRLLRDDTDFTVATASVSYANIQHMTNQLFSYSLGYTRNLSSGKGFERNRTGSDVHFNLFTASLNYQYRTKDDWIFGVRANGQYTGDSLVTTEQLGAGGMYSVRGFKERSASADKGVLGSFEIYTPEFAKNQRFVFFLDGAHLVNNRANANDWGSDNVASVGLGYRLFETKQGLSASIDYAHVLNEVNGRSDTHRPWHLSITQTF